MIPDHEGDAGVSRRLTIVMPSFNEEATIRQAVDRLLKTDLPLPIQLIVVDDGSTDGSMAKIRDVADRDEVLLLQHQRNLGKGAAVRTGLDAASGEFFTILDADLEYDPDNLVDLLTPLMNDEAEVVYGTRTFGSQSAYSFWYVIGNRFVSFWASLLFNAWLSDVETCFKVARTDAWRRLGLKSKGFALEAESTAKFLKAGYRIFEVPISYKARGREEGKKLQWTDGVQALWVFLRIRLFKTRKTAAKSSR